MRSILVREMKITYIDTGEETFLHIQERKIKKEKKYPMLERGTGEGEDPIKKERKEIDIYPRSSPLRKGGGRA